MGADSGAREGAPLTLPRTRAEIWGPQRPRSTPRGWLAAMRLPLGVAAVNYVAWPLVSFALSGGATTIGFNACRLAIMAWAGFRVARVAGARLVGTLLAGVAIMVLDHVVLKGGTFLVHHALGETVEEYGPNAYLVAFGGVVISFVMFCPIAAIAGALGGILGRRRPATGAA